MVASAPRQSVVQVSGRENVVRKSVMNQRSEMIARKQESLARAELRVARMRWSLAKLKGESDLTKMKFLKGDYDAAYKRVFGRERKAGKVRE